MHRKCECRLYPTKNQRAGLCAQAEACRQAYNWALSARRWFYEEWGLTRNYAAQCRDLTEARARHPEWKSVHTHALQGAVRLSGIGRISPRGNARFPLVNPTTCEVIERAGKWFLSVTFTLAAMPVRKRTGAMVSGLDWGVATFATVANADGSHEEIKNPRHLRHALSDRWHTLPDGSVISRDLTAARNLLNFALAWPGATGREHRPRQVRCDSSRTARPCETALTASV